MNKKSITQSVPFILLLVCLAMRTCFAQTTEFTYQGRLSDTITPQSATYDFEFRLCASESDCTTSLATQPRSGVAVSGGVFTVKLDFGATFFTGADRWLEIAVKRPAEANFTALLPRLKINSAPYSIRAANATAADALSAACVTCVTDAQIAGVAGSKVTGSVANATNATTAGNVTGIVPVANGGTGSSEKNFVDLTTTQIVAGDKTFSSAINTSSQYNIGGSRVLSVAGTSNLFAGVDAGTANTGDSNSFFGREAGRVNTTGSINSFFGAFAGGFNTTGENNSFFGAGAGRYNSTGGNNSFVGKSAGFSNTTGSINSFFGADAGFYNTTGNGNSFFGGSAGQANTAGGNNSFVGANAGFSNTTGNNNSFFGRGAGEKNTTGADNSLVGVFAGFFNTTGFGNSFVGRSAGQDNTTGNHNSFFGRSAGEKNTEGLDNSFVGAFAGINNTTGSFNSFVGRSAGQGNTTGNFNSFFGTNAGLANQTGGANSFFGESAGQNSTTGSENSFFGREAGRNNSAGDSNSYFGVSAGFSNTTGQENSFFGERAGRNNTTGNTNTFVGSESGLNNTTGSNNTVIGRTADVTNSNLSFATALGAGATVGTSNTVVLGRSLDTVRIPGTLVANLPAGDAGYIQNRTSLQASSNFNISGNGFIGGNVGIGTTTPGNKLDVNGGITAIGVTSNSLSSASSLFLNSAAGGRIAMRTSGGTSERMTILDNGNVGIGVTNPTDSFNVFNNFIVGSGGTVRLRLLNTMDTEEVCYNRAIDPGTLVTCSSSLRYKTNVRAFAPGMSFVNQLRPISFDWKDGGKRDVGFGAEDVEQIDPRFVFYNDAGQVEGVRYNRLTAVFVNAFKEQQTQIERQQKQIEALTRLVCLQSPEAEICREER